MKIPFISYLQVEEKIQCVLSKKVRYSEKPELLLTLPVPMDMATNKGSDYFNYYYNY